MTEVRNPYAPTPASLAPAPAPADSSGYWRDGNILVMLHSSVLPQRCVKCNAPAVTPLKQRTLYWHHPGLYALLLVNVVLYVIVALIVRKTAVAAPGLCDSHQRRRMAGIVFGWAGLIAGSVVTFIGLLQDSVGAVGLGLLAAVAGIAIGISLARVLYPQRIDTAFLRLKGCGKLFLNSLPQHQS